jgi:endoglucanase
MTQSHSRYRGCQVGPETLQVQIEDIMSLGANLIRWQLAPYPTTDMYDWWAQVDVGISRLSKILRAVPDMNFVVDLHSFPPDNSLDTLRTAWDTIRAKLNEFVNVLGYGVLNEPSRAVCRRAMNVGKRALAGSGKQLILTYPASDPARFKVGAPYLRDQQAWYEVHMYAPLRFTHQGIVGVAGMKYPTARLHKDKLRAILSPVRDFQVKHKRQIYVGEFSASDYADPESRFAYIRDCIELFEEWNWHWTFHAMYEAPVWNVMENTKCRKLILKHWGRNA